MRQGPCAGMSLETGDPKAAKEFYGALLGWGARKARIYRRVLNQARRIGGMMEMKGDMWKGIPPHWMPYFAGRIAIRQWLRSKPAMANQCVEPTDIPGTGRFAVLSDPQGAVFS